MMHLRNLALSMLFGLFAAGLAGAQQKQTGVVVKIGGLSSKTPADWRMQKPANRLRSYQFQLPDDRRRQSHATLAVIPNLTGDSDKNIARWKAMFKPEGTKSIEEVSKVYKKPHAIYLDIHGTYTNNHAQSGEKVIPMKGYRMIAVILKTKNGSSLIRVIGPSETVERHKKKFDKWLDGFGK